MDMGSIGEVYPKSQRKGPIHRDWQSRLFGLIFGHEVLKQEKMMVDDTPLPHILHYKH